MLMVMIRSTQEVGNGDTVLYTENWAKEREYGTERTSCDPSIEAEKMQEQETYYDSGAGGSS